MLKKDSSYMRFFKITEIEFEDRPYDIKGYDSVIFRGCTEKVEGNGFEMSTHSNVVIDLTKSIEELWKDFERNTQKQIRRAERRKGEFEIRINSNYKEFAELHRRFSVAKGMPPIEPNDARSDLSKLSGYLSTIWYKNQLVSGCFYYSAGTRVIYTTSASTLPFATEEDKVVIGNLNRYMHWMAIRRAKEEGFKQFDMGNVEVDKGVPTSSIARFKFSFGGSIAARYNYIKDYSIALKITRKAIRAGADAAHALGIYNLPFKSLGRTYI